MVQLPARSADFTCPHERFARQVLCHHRSLFSRSGATKKSRVATALFVGVALFATTAYALTRWVETPNDASCKTVCEAQGLRPVVSGKYKGGAEFYACAGNAQGEGPRGGYNLNGGACVVGWGGKEIPVRPFQCLCD